MPPGWICNMHRNKKLMQPSPERLRQSLHLLFEGPCDHVDSCNLPTGDLPFVPRTLDLRSVCHAAIYWRCNDRGSIAAKRSKSQAGLMPLLEWLRANASMAGTACTDATCHLSGSHAVKQLCGTDVIFLSCLCATPCRPQGSNQQSSLTVQKQTTTKYKNTANSTGQAPGCNTANTLIMLHELHAYYCEDKMAVAFALGTTILGPATGQRAWPRYAQLAW